MAPSRNDVVPSLEINICNSLCRSGNSSTLGSLGEQSQHMRTRSARSSARSRTGEVASAEATGGAMASKAGRAMASKAGPTAIASVSI
jgi:hypothetical protein